MRSACCFVTVSQLFSHDSSGKKRYEWAEYLHNRLHAYRDSVTMTVFDWCFKRQEYPRTLSLGYLNGAAAQTRGFEPGPVECWGGRVVNGTGL